MVWHDGDGEFQPGWKREHDLSGITITVTTITTITIITITNRPVELRSEAKREMAMTMTWSVIQRFDLWER
jgi:hypothetical protein